MKFENTKKCPECGFEFVALYKIEIIMGDIKVTVNGVDDITTDTCNNNGARGVIVKRYYVCEEGHEFIEEEQFHKGQTYVDTTIIIKSCLWRD